ncbi:MAG: NAD/NADP octopine/nopaline dehydrogenase family protein [Gammaproteobacteria bacterium]
MKVAILGAGAGAVSAVVELGLQGHAIRLWNRREESLEPLRQNRGVDYSGVLGEGRADAEVWTTDLREAVAGAEALLVCLPTTAHESVARTLADQGLNDLPVVLNPGHTGGALAFREVFRRAGMAAPPVAEFSTLTYVARRPDQRSVSTTGVAGQVRVAALPGDEAAVEAALGLYPSALPAADVMTSGLANVNMVLHPPGAILGAAWVEATGGDFTFYVQGLTDGTGRVLRKLDEERLAVARAYDVTLPDLFHEMQAIGTIEPDTDPAEGVVSAIRAGKANSAIKAPDSLDHRYYREDFHYGLQPFLVFADIAGVDVPVARSLMALAEALLESAGTDTGRTAKSMGIDGKSRQQLIEMIRGS